MRKIIEVHFPGLPENLMKAAMARFYELREIDDFRKKPSTSELVDWIKVLLASGIRTDEIRKKTPFTGALLKKEVDHEYFINNFLPHQENTVRARKF